jgi:hypothetical protein
MRRSALYSTPNYWYPARLLAHLFGLDILSFCARFATAKQQTEDAQKRHRMDTNFTMTNPCIYQAHATISKRELHRTADK